MSKVASPTSTGGAGNTFEASVCTYYLAVMLSGLPARGLELGPCTEVRCQRRYQDFHCDDIVIECGEGESVRRLAIQAKLRLRFSESDSVFGEVMDAAWRTFLSGAFRQGKDRVGLAIGGYGTRADEQAAEVSEWARHSAAAADFFERIDQPGLSNESMRGFLRAVLGVLRAAGHSIGRENQFWEFLRSLVILDFDFSRPSSRDHLNALDILRGGDRRRSLDDTRALYDALFRAATRCIERAGSHRRETLFAVLGTSFDRGASRDAQPPSPDQRPSSDYFAFPRTPRGTSVFVGREDELRDLSDALVLRDGGPRFPTMCALQGMPGIGKSFLVDRLAEVHQEHFRGGYLRLTLSAHEERSLGELGDVLADRLGLDPGQDRGWGGVRRRLREPPTLLHIENADGERSAGIAARIASALGGCAVVVTGRFLGLGRLAGWLRRELAPFDEATAVAQLAKEHRMAVNADEAADFRALACALGCLPLALHLAAGYLYLEGSAASFLTLLRDTSLRLEPSDPADELFVREPHRAVLASTFELSLGLLRRVLGDEAERSMNGLHALGHAPTSGFGECFGAALAGLSAGEFNILMIRAHQLSLVEVARPREHGTVRWRIHPLLAELLRGRADNNAVLSRRHAWFVARLRQDAESTPTDAARARRDIDDEPDALAAWLSTLDDALWREVAEAGRVFALQNGPFHVWRSFFERGLAAQNPAAAPSEILMTFSHLARLTGDCRRALECAAEAVCTARAIGEPDPLIDALSLLAQSQLATGDIESSLDTWLNDVQPLLGRAKDVARRFHAVIHIGPALASRGEPERGLRLLVQQAELLRGLTQWETPRALLEVQAALILIRLDRCDEALAFLEEASPPLERHGTPREFVVARDAMAQILADREEYEPALTIWNDEVIPVLERLGAKSDVAVMRNKAALMMANLGRVDAAMEATREQLALFQQIGNRHGEAVSFNQLAELLGRQSRDDEALAIYLERSLPILEELQEPRELALTFHNAAYVLIHRGASGDRALASTFSDRAVTLGLKAEMPEVETFLEFASEQGFWAQVAEKALARFAAARDAQPWDDDNEADTEEPGRARVAHGEPCHCGSGRKYERCHGSH